MTDIDRLEHRLAAVERVLVDDERRIDDLAELATVTRTLETLEEHLTEHERRIAAVEGATQSVDGFVDHVTGVNEAVEQQANTAIATVDRLERRIRTLEDRLERLECDSTERDSRATTTQVLDSPSESEEVQPATTRASTATATEGSTGTTATGSKGTTTTGSTPTAGAVDDEETIDQTVEEIFATSTSERSERTPVSENSLEAGKNSSVKASESTHQVGESTQQTIDERVTESATVSDTTAGAETGRETDTDERSGLFETVWSRLR